MRLFLPLVLLVTAVTGCTSVRVPAEMSSIGFEWVYIEGGPYMMGDLAEVNQDALPLHGVRIEPFYISRYETTLEQYDLFAQKTGRETVLPDQVSRGTRAAGNMTWEGMHIFDELRLSLGGCRSANTFSEGDTKAPECSSRISWPLSIISR